MRSELIEQIADDIIGYSDGSFNMYQPEEYDTLTAEEKHAVDEIVNNEIWQCAICGWNWHVNNLEHSPRLGESVCHYCWDDAEHNEEEEDEA